MRNTTCQTRENRTITVDFHNEATYYQLLGDGKAFVECVLAFLFALGFQLKHKATCGGGRGSDPPPPPYACPFGGGHYLAGSLRPLQNAGHGPPALSLSLSPDCTSRRPR